MRLSHSPTELTTAATDAALGLLSLALLLWLARTPARAPFSKRVWLSVFGLLALGSALGAAAHGLDLPQHEKTLLWRPLYLSLGLCVGLFFVGGVADSRGERSARAVPPWAVAAGVGLFVVTQVSDNFLYFILYETVAMVGALVMYASLWFARRSIGAARVSVGIALTLAAAAVQVSSLSARIVWPFDHNGLFHLVQIVAVVVMASGLRAEMA